MFLNSGQNGKLRHDEVVKQIFEADNEGLVAEITQDEVKEAVFSMHPDKAPGIDGLNPDFF